MHLIKHTLIEPKPLISVLHLK